MVEDRYHAKMSGPLQSESARDGDDMLRDCVRVAVAVAVVGDILDCARADEEQSFG